MFTGIVEEIGTLRHVAPTASGARLEIACRRVLERLAIDDSVNVAGACLTVVQRDDRGFVVDVVPETLARTTLAGATRGTKLNLERAATPTTALGGHLVQGHVDGTTKLVARKDEGEGARLRFALPSAHARYVVVKGDLTLAAELTDADDVAFIRKYASGVICVPMTAERLEQLDLPQMVARNEARLGTAFTVSVDAREGVTTGISAADRARTIKLLADPKTRPADLVKPAHIFPPRPREGGGLVRVDSECLTGHVFGSQRCDCREQLEAALARIAKEGRGVFLYLRQEGRGIGLMNKLRAYALQDQGLDTVEANEKLGFKPDQREYGIGVQILLDLGVRKARILTNNPHKLVSLYPGLEVVERVPIEVEARATNRGYLATKRTKL